MGGRRLRPPRLVFGVSGAALLLLQSLAVGGEIVGVLRRDAERRVEDERVQSNVDMPVYFTCACACV